MYRDCRGCGSKGSGSAAEDVCGHDVDADFCRGVGDLWIDCCVTSVDAESGGGYDVFVRVDLVRIGSYVEHT